VADEPEKEIEKDDGLKAWQLEKVTPDEAIEVLERRASQIQSEQARLVENGDRESPFVDYMRDAHVMFHTANMLRLKMANESQGRRGGSMPTPMKR
jgi:hypothetical protein